MAKSKKYNVGISVLTENIPKHIVERFIYSVEFDSQPTVSYVVFPFDSNFCDMHTEHKGTKYFNRNKGHNFGIKTLADLCEVIICADVDVLIPKGYIDFSYEQAFKQPFCGVMRKLDKGESITPRRWEEWDKKYPPMSVGYGPWNALTTEDWYKTKGWHEDLFSWGFDRHIWFRMQHAGLNPIRYDRKTTYHVYHPGRNKNIKHIAPEIQRKVRQSLDKNFL